MDGGQTWGFCSTESLRVGDVLVTRRAKPAYADALDEEQIAGRVRTVALHVPGTNTYLADGVWMHNDISGTWSQTATHRTRSAIA